MFVDDVLVTSSDIENLYKFKKDLESKYGPLKALHGTSHPFLGMQFNFGDGFVHVDMIKFNNIMLEEFEDFTGIAESPASNEVQYVNKDSPLLNAADSKRCFRGIQMCAWLASRNRLELGVAVAFLKTRVSKLTEEDLSKFKRVIMYLRKYPKLRIRFTGNTDYQLTSCIDTSFGSYESGHGGTGACTGMGTGSLFAESSKQKIMTLSSTEAELVGAVDKAKKVIWANYFLSYQRHDSTPQPPAIIMQDNQSTIKLILHGSPLSQRTKHISIRYFFLKERIENGELVIQYLRTEDMIADILTKALQGAHFRRLRALLLGE